MAKHLILFSLLIILQVTKGKSAASKNVLEENTLWVQGKLLELANQIQQEGEKLKKILDENVEKYQTETRNELNRSIAEFELYQNEYHIECFKEGLIQLNELKAAEVTLSNKTTSLVKIDRFQDASDSCVLDAIEDVTSMLYKASKVTAQIFEVLYDFMDHSHICKDSIPLKDWIFCYIKLLFKIIEDIFSSIVIAIKTIFDLIGLGFDLKYQIIRCINSRKADIKLQLMTVMQNAETCNKIYKVNQINLY